MLRIKSLNAIIVIFMLNIISLYSANDDDIQTIEILGSKQACLNKVYTYMTSTTTGTKYEWTVSGGVFKDGNKSSAVQVAWTSPGNGIIKLVTTNLQGVKDSSTLYVSILPKNTFQIYGNVNPCQSAKTKYYIDNPQKLSLNWRAYNGTIVGTKTKDTVEVLWTYSGTGNVTVIVENSIGCNDTSVVTVAVSTMPIPTIIGSSSACSDIEYEYKTDYSSNMIYKWTVSRGMIVGADYYPSVKILWDTVGQGQVYLTTTSRLSSCSASMAKYVSVSKKPDVKLKPFDEVCYIDEDIILTGGTPAGGYYSGQWVIEGNKFRTYFAGIGNHYIKYSVSNGNGCEVSQTQILTINSLPSKPIVRKIDTLLLSTTKYGNQWYLNGEILPDDTTEIIVPKMNGSYTIQTTNSKGCLSEISEPYIVTHLSIDKIKDTEIITVLNNKELTIKSDELINSVRISNYMGQLLIEKKFDNYNTIYQIDVNSLNTGVYIIQINSNKRVYYKNLLLNQ